MKGVGEENVIDRRRQHRMDGHGVRHDKPALAGARRSEAGPRAVQHGRVDVDGVAAKGDARERGREQSGTATQIDRHHAGRDAHFGENPRRIWPQRPPLLAIGHCCCEEKPDYHAALMHAPDGLFNRYDD
jgi:hypothetical protein